ncbi:Uncharacterized protein DAT39_016409, partial [Clarias magur]
MTGQEESDYSRVFAQQSVCESGDEENVRRAAWMWYFQGASNTMPVTDSSVNFL